MEHKPNKFIEVEFQVRVKATNKEGELLEFQHSKKLPGSIFLRDVMLCMAKQISVVKYCGEICADLLELCMKESQKAIPDETKK